VLVWPAWLACSPRSWLDVDPLWHKPELRSGLDPRRRGFQQWGVRCCRLRDRWVRQAVDLALGRVLRASDRGLFVGVDARV
jgi:hypothetical protein